MFFALLSICVHGICLCWILKPAPTPFRTQVFPSGSTGVTLEQYQYHPHPHLFGAECPAAAAKSLQSCPTLCDPIDGSPPGSPVPEILQARTLEWVAISFSYAWKWKVKVKLLSLVWLLATPWTAAYQAPPSMGFSRQEYWSGCHCLLRLNVLAGYKAHSLLSLGDGLIP